MKSDIRVLHINCNYAGRVLHETMVQHLSPLLERCAVFVPLHYHPSKAFTGEVVISTCFKKYDRFFFDLKQQKILAAAQRSFSIPDFELLHAHTLFTDGNCACTLSGKYGIPYIAVVRNEDINVFLKYFFFLRPRGIKILKNASAVIFLSEACKEYVLSKYVPAKLRPAILEKCSILPNGIDDFWFCHPGKARTLKASGHIHILYAGGVNKNKNPLATLSAIELLRQRGYSITYTVVGKAEDESVLRQLTQSGAVQYHPACGKEELLAHYRACDLFVMPSFTETFGLVYAEAMSQGLPVLYSRQQGFDRQFPEGMVGYAVDPYNAKDIADKILQVLNRYDEISANCLRCVEKFNWNRIVEQYQDIYTSILRHAAAENAERSKA